MVAAEKAAQAAYNAASAAADAAYAAFKHHVVGLLRMANAVHITTAADPDANSDESEAELIRKNKNAHVVNVNTAVAAAAGDAAHGGAEVTVTWPHSATVANAVADEDTERTGKPLISVDPGGDGGAAVALQHATAGADEEDGTDDDLKDNFGQGPGLGDFVHEKYISGLDGDTNDDFNDFNNQRVIVFTDLEQATEPKDGTSDALDNQPVASVSRVTIAATPEGEGAQGPGVTTPRMFAGSYDHDGNPATPAFTGDFICVIPSCSYSLSGTGGTTEAPTVIDGTTVTALSGYNFTGTRTVLLMRPMEDTTWLAFGVWLTETVVDTDTDDTNTYAFGAFADGGDETESTEGQVVTGDATYRGKAAGVHSTARAVDFFHGDATLNAKFGTRAANGLITGRIHNIVSGGESVSDSIYLYLTDQDMDTPEPNNIDDDGSFDGRTRMGTGTLGDDGEYDYPMNGTWAGSFYNPVADDTDTEDVMEDETAPGSVAGTFSVSRGNDADTEDFDETESYVGAFGAHCSGANCGDH